MSSQVKVQKITALLFAEQIEPSVSFWVERLGFTKAIEVPDGDKLAFVALKKDNLELMYQTFKSVDDDAGTRVESVRKGPSFLYVDVEDIQKLIAAMNGVEVTMPLRDTFYGAKEIAVKEPAGHIVTFAQQG
ncbi:MAG: hypothetical protein JWO13_3256 [Acidobacteriales bacterium]|nr:hypothetical protein [Terriglobales bacterium]